MEEIEIKVLDIDVDRVRNRILELGGKLHFDGVLTDEIYDTAMWLLKQKNGYLRVRCANEKTILTVKTGLTQGNTKIAQEFETEVENRDALHHILDALDVEKTLVTTKHREEYYIGNVSCVIDTYPDTPSYLEIEGPSEQAVFQMAQQLGFSKEQCTSMNGGEVRKLYQQKRNN